LIWLRMSALSLRSSRTISSLLRTSITSEMAHRMRPRSLDRPPLYASRGATGSSGKEGCPYNLLYSSNSTELTAVTDWSVSQAAPSAYQQGHDRLRDLISSSRGVRQLPDFFSTAPRIFKELVGVVVARRSAMGYRALFGKWLQVLLDSSRHGYDEQHPPDELG
jgi:hypothetical protein